MAEDISSLKIKIAELEASIAGLNDEFLIRSQQLTDELNAVRKLAVQIEQKSVKTPVISTAAFDWQQFSTNTLAINTTQQDADSDFQLTSTDHSIAHHQKDKDDIWDDLQLEQDDVESEPAIEKPLPQKPGFAEILVSNFFHSFLGFLLNSLSLLKAPFQELFYKLINLYTFYQKQGKAPVFLMTVGGLITLTFGFGYLLQYSFNTLFNDTLKALTGFVIGGLITAAGVWLSVKKTEYREYAASVIALGIIFNYLTAYFIGPHYAIVGETTGFLLLLAVTTISFALALLFETRVVSAVTLVGGVFMPFVVGDVEAAGLVFLGYLLLLSSANLFLVLKINWPALAQLSFVLSLSVIEYVGISETIYPIAAISVLSAFFYLYTWFFTFDGVRLKEELSRHELTVLVANIFYFIYAMLQISAEPVLLATALITHAVILGLVMKVLCLMQSVLAPIYLLMIGLLIATAVFVLSPADVTSIIWAIEGLAMLYIGFRYSHKLIRAEGYVIYLIAMLSLLWQAVDAFIFIDQTGFAWHWINLVAFGGLSFIAYRIIYRFKALATGIELKSAFVQNEIFTFWGVIAISLVFALYVPSLMWVLAVIPVIWCFYRVSRHQLRFAQLIGFLLFGAFIVQIILGLIDTNSSLISQQPVLSWIAILEVLFLCWGVYFYFKHNEILGRGFSFATQVHQWVFYTPFLLTVLGFINIIEFQNTDLIGVTFSYPWFDLIFVAGLLSALYWLVTKTEVPAEKELRTRHAYELTETAAFLGSVFFLYSVFIVAGEWMFNAAIIPLFGLLYLALKKQLPLTEKLAWAHFLLFAAGIFISYQIVGNLHFSEQSWSTKLLLIEVLFSGWFLQWVYQRSALNSNGYTFASVVRIAVYCFIPLLFLPRIIRLYPDYLAVALWGSFVICWLMYKKLNIESLLKEVILLFFIAVLATVVISFDAISGANELPGLLALVSGLLVVSTFHVIEKTLSETNIKHSSYHIIQLSSPYFYGFLVAGLSFAVVHQISISLLFTGWYFLWLMLNKRFLVVTRESYLLAYALTWLLLTMVPLLILYQALQPVLFVRDYLVFITSVVDLMALFGLWVFTHRRFASLQLFKRKYAGQNIQFWFFHVMVLIAYMGSLNMIFSQWSVGISIAMLIHAVVILFLTLQVKYKGLLRLSIALYGLTAIKVLFYDMNDFGNLHKVFALMAIGSILMAAAFLFQKLKTESS